jgi:serine/threonine protein kinase
MYEIMNLKRPFEGGNILALVNNITNGQPEPLDLQYSFDLRALISCMLAKEPKQRPSVNTLLVVRASVSLNTHTTSPSTYFFCSLLLFFLNFYPLQLPFLRNQVQSYMGKFVDSNISQMITMKRMLGDVPQQQELERRRERAREKEKEKEKEKVCTVLFLLHSTLFLVRCNVF